VLPPISVPAKSPEREPELTRGDAPASPLRPFRPPVVPEPRATGGNPPSAPPPPQPELTSPERPLLEAILTRDPHLLAPALAPAPRPFLPPEFERNAALYCQKRIGQWTQPDAYNLLGDATRERPALSDGEENGRIYAFNDPTGHYQELELDFAADTGLLRAVFVYPWRMTWIDCRRLWGGNVMATKTGQGRTFYSYLNRRLDVLVDPSGKVISLGLY
jgi:hypothetical protein